MTIEQNQEPSQALEFQDVGEDVQSLSVDRFVVDGLLFSYLDELESKNPESGKAIRMRMNEDEKFLQLAQRATLDAIVFSTFANTVGNRVFEESLEQVKPLTDEPDLLQMRKTMFDFGVELAALNAGGSPNIGRLKERSTQFHEVADVQ